MCSLCRLKWKKKKKKEKRETYLSAIYIIFILITAIVRCEVDSDQGIVINLIMQLLVHQLTNSFIIIRIYISQIVIPIAYISLSLLDLIYKFELLQAWTLRSEGSYEYRES